MAHNYSNLQNPRKTPQNRPIPGREKEMIKNNAGGYSFTIDKWSMLNRFLILGSESNTYYVSNKKLTEQNIQNSLECIKDNPKRVLETIVDISKTGRAPKNDQAIFLLAALLAHSKNRDVKREVAEKLPEICRIGTHLFTFAHYVNDMRGWGRIVRNAIANWYSMEPSKLEYQMIKYKGRTVEGTKNQWTHRDVLRSAHVKPISKEHDELFRWTVKGEYQPVKLKLIAAYEELMKTDNKKRAEELIVQYKIPHDAWPTQLKNDADIWKLALPSLPLTALIRNLGKLTQIGVIQPGKFDELELIIEKLTDKEYVKKSRIHPMNALIAMKTYNNGGGYRGSLTWRSVRKITDALEETFYLSFGNVESTGKRTLLALDVSGSMTQHLPGAPMLSCAEGVACMAMVTARVESKHTIMGFCDSFVNLEISPKMSLTEVYKNVQKYNFGRTDCSLPMLWANQQNIDYDTFIVMTDNETWAGEVHPTQALNSYRKTRVKDAKLIVVGMTATNVSIGDPKDLGTLNVVGFDTATPQIMSEFSKGNV
jgi:60 kDa SS-A/Ro ribonucleoprotein